MSTIIIATNQDWFRGPVGEASEVSHRGNISAIMLEAERTRMNKAFAPINSMLPFISRKDQSPREQESMTAPNKLALIFESSNCETRYKEIIVEAREVGSTPSATIESNETHSDEAPMKTE